MVPITCSTSALSAAVTQGSGNSAVMPWPTSAGVLGMQRTTRSVPTQRQMLSVRMPAATDRCNALPVCGMTGAAASLNICGLTAQTTRSAWAKASPAADKTVMPKSLCSLAAVSAKGSTTVICLGCMP